MKAYDSYLKIAILSAGIFGALSWGQEGSETLPPCGFTLWDPSFVPPPSKTACDSISIAIGDSIRRANQRWVPVGFRAFGNQDQTQRGKRDT